MQGNALFPAYLAGFIVLMAVIITASIRAAKKRTRELTEVAQQIGFRFVGEGKNIGWEE